MVCHDSQQRAVSSIRIVTSIKRQQKMSYVKG
jgi:hypothetical protein